MPRMISPPGADEYAPFYAGYVARVAGADVGALLASQGSRLEELLGDLTEEQALHRYAPGKWSVKEVVGHLADSERVLTYRALRIGRGDETPLAGFDEAAYVAAAGFDRRTIGDLLGEFAAVRAATLAWYGSLDDAAVLRRGIANHHPVSVRALIYIVAGHVEHHFAILGERYGIAAAPAA